MPCDPSSSQPSANAPKLPPWLIVVLFLLLLGISWWQNRQARLNQPATEPELAQVEQQSNSANPESESPKEESTSRDKPSARPELPSTPTEVAPRRSDLPERSVPAKNETVRPKDQTASRGVRIENQTIRDQDGGVLYRGTIDLQPTLDRIARGERNSHRNDGTTFQNRERKLPQKPSGYYREYVHPTPKGSGPGPQRVIVGKEGDVWYTPDHYNSFQKIK